MPIYKPGTVVLVNFPFTDLQSSKVRPALVLTTKGDDVIILGIFSKVPDEFRDSWIKIDEIDADFHLTGLKKTSSNSPSRPDPERPFHYPGTSYVFILTCAIIVYMNNGKEKRSGSNY